MSRNTVKKYVATAEPVGKVRQARARPVFENVRPRIESLLDEWSGRTTAKQRITASLVHRQLVKEGVAVGITTVQLYFRERRRKSLEVYIPLVHRPGDEAQVDFFEVTVDVAGKRQKAWKFLMRLMHSKRDFAWLYDRCDQISFLDAHVRAFAHFGAVPQRCIYDNLTPAVRKVTFPRRELAARFRALACHYLFEPCFARPGVGHDKGGVEARGRGIRLRHLTPIPRGDTLDQLSQELLTALDDEAETKRDREGATAMDRFAIEKPLMLPLVSTPFEPRASACVTVSRQAKVRVAGATYSVPSSWRLLQVNALVGVDMVTVTCNGKVIEHQRQSSGGTSIRYSHYLSELARKPQAVRQVIVELLDELPEAYAKLWRLLVDTHGPVDAARVFARVLEAVTEHDEHVVAKALERALAADRLDLLGLCKDDDGVVANNPVPAKLADHEVESACASDYDALLGGER